jgi:hypothetical protein
MVVPVDGKNKLGFRQCPIIRVRFSKAEEWGKSPHREGHGLQALFDLPDELHLKFDAVAINYRRAMNSEEPAHWHMVD